MVDEVQVQFIVHLKCSWTYRNDGRVLGLGYRLGNRILQILLADHGGA